MSGEDKQTRADEETLPDTPLHAYKEGREDDVEGDVDKLKSGDPHKSQRKEIEGEDAGSGDHIEAHPKRDPAEGSEHGADERTGARTKDNPTPSDDAGQKGGGTATGAIGGMEHGSEPRGQDAREHERP